jgi:hypothetical protein
MTGDYDLAVIRELLIAAFTAEELGRFCQDRPSFRPVCDTFGPGHGLDDMAAELLTYARKRSLLPELLSAVQAYNPRQYARFQGRLVLAAGDRPPAPAAPALPQEGAAPPPLPLRAWGLLGLLALDLALLLFWGWCLLSHRPDLMAYLQTAFTILGVVLAFLALFIVVRRPLAWDDLLRRLAQDRRWLYLLPVLTLVALVATPFVCDLGRPPTAYMALVLDNGPVPEERQLEELKAMLRSELGRSLPNAALSLRVFGLQCGGTQRLVGFSTGNASRVAQAVGGVQPVARSDLTEAVRQALDDLLSQRGDQPRVLVVVTWGQEGCGGDLEQALDAYRRQLGGAVSLNFIALGDLPAVVESDGVYVDRVTDAREAGRILGTISDALEKGEVPRPPIVRTPAPTRSP